MDVDGELDHDGELLPGNQGAPELLPGNQGAPERSDLQRRQAGGPTHQPPAASLQGSESDDNYEHNASLASAAEREILLREEGALSPTHSGSNCQLGNDLKKNQLPNTVISKFLFFYY